MSGPEEMTDLTALKAKNARRWANAKVTRNFTSAAKRLVAQKARYQTVAKKTGVPWFVIAVIHERESAQSFLRSLAQGDPWNRKSTHVPKGRGPFNSWEEAAIDALVDCPPHAARWKDWSPGGTMTLLEQYNGLGYATKGRPSPYVWAGTDQYVKGKYVADGQYDPNHVDQQLGCAGLIVAMRELDQSISFIDQPKAEEHEPPPKAEPKPAEPDDTEPHAAPKGDAKTGVTEGAKAAGGLGIMGFLYSIWEQVTQAPETILQAIVGVAQKPTFWLFAGVVGAGAYIWWRRSNMKKANQ